MNKQLEQDTKQSIYQFISHINELCNMYGVTLEIEPVKKRSSIENLVEYEERLKIDFMFSIVPILIGTKKLIDEMGLSQYKKMLQDLFGIEKAEEEIEKVKNLLELTDQYGYSDLKEFCENLKDHFGF